MEASGYDLIPVMTPFWDVQMISLALNWLDEKQIYKSEDLVKAKSQIKNITEIRQEDISLIKQDASIMEHKLEPYILALMAYKNDQKNRMGGLPESKTIKELSEWCHRIRNPSLGIKEEDLNFPADSNEKLLRLAKLYYSLKDYKKSKYFSDLYVSYILELIYEGSDITKAISCHWGIACVVIMKSLEELNALEITENNQNAQDLSNGEDGHIITEETLGKMRIEEAVKSILKIAEILDINPNAMNRNSLIVQRSWLIHWAIWPLFTHYLPCFLNISNYCQGYDPCWTSLINWLMEEKNSTIIQLVCPHILRYYAVIIILDRKKSDHFQHVIKLISSFKLKAPDPFTSLLEALFINFDFNAAQQYMVEIGDVCSSDFFLEPLKTSIEEHCRLMIFEIYCRIHKSININMISSKMNMSPEMAERWIVNLIRNAKLEAKIDSEKNRVKMSVSVPSIHQQVFEKTRNVISRSSVIHQNLSQILSGKADPEFREVPNPAHQQKQNKQHSKSNWQHQNRPNHLSNGLEVSVSNSTRLQPINEEFSFWE